MMSATAVLATWAIKTVKLGQCLRQQATLVDPAPECPLDGWVFGG